MILIYGCKSLVSPAFTASCPRDAWQAAGRALGTAVGPLFHYLASWLSPPAHSTQTNKVGRWIHLTMVRGHHRLPGFQVGAKKKVCWPQIILIRFTFFFTQFCPKNCLFYSFPCQSHLLSFANLLEMEMTDVSRNELWLGRLQLPGGL